MSKINQAIEIVKSNNLDKALSIAAIMAELTVTKANAYIYFVKSIDRLGAPSPVKVRQAKTEETATVEAHASGDRFFNKTTETTIRQAKGKIKVIDQFIQAIEAPRNPFSGLGV